MRLSKRPGLWQHLALIAVLVLVANRTRHHLRRTQCIWAATVVRNGRTIPTSAELDEAPDDSELVWRADPVRTVNRCGTFGGAAIATGLLALAHETNVRRLETFMNVADSWRDSAVYSSALRVLADDGASPEARVYAIRHLLALTQPNMSYTYRGLVMGDSIGLAVRRTGTLGWACGGVMVTGRTRRFGSALPADYVAKSVSALDAVKSDPSAPVSVRNAAGCLP